jgi:hypothetical protein
MGHKTTVDYSKYIDAQSMGASVTGPSTNIMNTDRVGFQIVWTGSPTGDFTVEISNDATTWTEMTLSTPVAAAGSADNAFIDCESAAKYIRLVYTRTSGTGTLNVHITAKSISG